MIVVVKHRDEPDRLGRLIEAARGDGKPFDWPTVEYADSARMSINPKFCTIEAATSEQAKIFVFQVIVEHVARTLQEFSVNRDSFLLGIHDGAEYLEHVGDKVTAER